MTEYLSRASEAVPRALFLCDASLQDYHLDLILNTSRISRRLDDICRCLCQDHMT